MGRLRTSRVEPVWSRCVAARQRATAEAEFVAMGRLRSVLSFGTCDPPRKRGGRVFGGSVVLAVSTRGTDAEDAELRFGG